MTWHSHTKPITLGDWAFTLSEDEIEHLAWRGNEVVRSVRAVVRDQDWATLPFTISAVVVEDDRLSLHMWTVLDGVRIAAAVLVSADADDLTIALNLVAHGNAMTNRGGLVVLHRADDAGRPLRAVHADGSMTSTSFPVEISPHQPVESIRELSWNRPGVAINVLFTGDTFEMEDQRNWTDASFKTYSRPLSSPFPYMLTAATPVKQSVRIAAAFPPAKAPAPRPDLITLRAGGSVPAVGTSASTEPDPSPDAPTIGSSLLVEVDLRESCWRSALDRAAAVGIPLDLRLIVGHCHHGSIFDDVLQRLAPLSVARIGAFRSDGPAAHVSDELLVTLLREALVRAKRQIPVIGGSRAHFTELNRERHRLPAELDGHTFSMTPLFHAESTEQLIESLAVQRLVAEQAVRHARGLPVHIGPVTLRPRFNNVATTPAKSTARSDLRDGYGHAREIAPDTRQSSAELGAWTMASAAALAVPGVASIAWFEHWGARGVFTAGGHPRAVAAVLRVLDASQGQQSLTGGSTPDGRVWAWGAREGNGAVTLMAANLDRVARRFTVRCDQRDVVVDLAAGEWMASPW